MSVVLLWFGGKSNGFLATFHAASPPMSDTRCSRGDVKTYFILL